MRVNSKEISWKRVLEYWSVIRAYGEWFVSSDDILFGTNRSRGERLRMACWHLTFSPFFPALGPLVVSLFTLLPGCFEPEQYDWIIEAYTASSGYRLEVKSPRGMEAERHLEVCIPTEDFDIRPSPAGILIERLDFPRNLASYHMATNTFSVLPWFSTAIRRYP